MIERPRVFLSYAREDQAQVAEVYDFLKTKGHRPWMDVKDLKAADDWNLSIQRAIRHCSYFLAFISSHSVDRGGVLGEEIAAAVAIRGQNLEGENYLIPIRLDQTAVPPPLNKYQWLDYNAAGWNARLLQTLGPAPRRARYYIASGAVAAVAVTAMLGLLLFRYFAPTETFRRSREEVKPVTLTTTPLMIGMTLWALRPSIPKDLPSARVIFQPLATDDSGGELTPARVSLQDGLSFGDKFRVGIESSQPGCLYIVDQERGDGGPAGAASLIFPTGRSYGTDPHVRNGMLIELPSLTSRPPYWKFRSTGAGYRGELLTIILSAEPLADFVVTSDVRELESSVFPAIVSDMLVSPTSTVNGEAGALPTSSESLARSDRSRHLTRDDPPPESIYTLKPRSNRGVAFQVQLRVKK